MIAEPTVEAVELAAAGKVAVEHEVGRLLEGDGPGEILDAIASIFEPALTLATFEVADRRLAGDDPFEAGVERLGRRGAHVEDA